MKKIFLALSLCVFAGTFSSAQEVFADDYMFQKQIHINDNYSCQAIRIHPNWLLTAGHCVAPFIHKSSCSIRLIVARGNKAQASLVKDCSQVFVPKAIAPDEQSQLSWDMALIRFPLPSQDMGNDKEMEMYEFHTLDGDFLQVDEFEEILEQDPSLYTQWNARHSQDFPLIYTYEREHGKFLQNRLLVPRWGDGGMTYEKSPKLKKTDSQSEDYDKQVAYLGNNGSLWESVGFNVEKGNSGGAVVALRPGKKPALIGIVSAGGENPGTSSKESKESKESKKLNESKKALPEVAQAKEVFVFTGFSRKTTVRFIEKTLNQFADKIATQKIFTIMDPQNPMQETEKIRVK